ncbi:MAG: molybdopterin-dependent oxidoreductase [Actinomycetota bacterium]|nr:molybdopterin-dependent oxidoreductase [Actinomycetota bacterium]
MGNRRSQAVQRKAAVAGIAGAAVALAVGELVAALVPGVPSLVVSVGAAVIDRVPSGVKNLAIAVFGLYDKLALNLGIAVIALLIGAVLGTVGLRRPVLVWAGFGGFGVLGFLTALGQPEASPGPAALSGAAAVVAGVLTLRGLLTMASAGPRCAECPAAGQADGDRRRFLVVTASVLAAAAVSAATGRYLIQRPRGPQAAIPPAGEPLVAPPLEASFDIPGLTPLVVPNDRFYRIDVSLVVPRVDVDTWRLKISGMVDREVELIYDEILAMPLVERYITIACVSNEVGGELVGNAAWRGVPLRTILDMAGVREGATQIVGRAVDGFTVGFPTALAYDGRDALLVVGMNGEPLPPAHGFPARLVVPGLYGHVSATKWLEEIELTTLEAFDAYWVPRGWAKFGPVKTQARIDVPRSGRVKVGPVTIAGVAWAPPAGIAKVEVSVDGEPWRQAELSAALSDDAWRQWRTEWEAQPGPHVLRVRASDKRGHVQEEQIRTPFPDGASGYHAVRVTAV